MPYPAVTCINRRYVGCRHGPRRPPPRHRLRQGRRCVHARPDERSAPECAIAKDVLRLWREQARGKARGSRGAVYSCMHCICSSEPSFSIWRAYQHQGVLVNLISTLLDELVSQFLRTASSYAIGRAGHAPPYDMKLLASAACEYVDGFGCKLVLLAVSRHLPPPTR